MRFQVISDCKVDDLYLRGSSCYVPVASNVDGLIIAGDLASPFHENFVTFLRWASSSYTNVIYIKGNYEVTGHFVGETDEKIESIVSSFSNVHYLNRRSIVLNDPVTKKNVFFIGATLWSRINLHDEFENILQHPLFTSIHGWTIKKNNEEHEKDLKFITDTLQLMKQNEGDERIQNVVVITHHAPMVTNTLHPKYEKDKKYNDLYCTDLSALVNNDLKKVWIYGHSQYGNMHFSDNRNTVLVSNPYMNDENNYNPYFVINL